MLFQISAVLTVLVAVSDALVASTMKSSSTNGGVIMPKANGGLTGCTCPAVLAPVCGNGKTYDNECLAKCDNVEKTTPGSCKDGKKDCSCPAMYEPVCSGGRIYANACLAKCNGIEDFKYGECKPNQEDLKESEGKATASSMAFATAKATAEGDDALFEITQGEEKDDASLYSDEYAMGVDGIPVPVGPGAGASAQAEAEANAFAGAAANGLGGHANASASAQASAAARAGAGAGAFPPMPKKDCACPKFYQPVCADNKTFGNECEAICERKFSFVPGECKK